MKKSSAGPSGAWRNVTTTLLGAVLAAAIGCSSTSPEGGTSVQAPVVTFTFNPASPQVDEPVAFTDGSTHAPTTWAWSFGDGATSTAQHPSHAFGAAGTYTVTLFAANAAGANLATREVTVAAAALAPVAAFTFTPASPSAGEVVTFTDGSSNAPTAWAWDFGDGATSTAQHPTHAYAAAGSYTVTLVSSNAAGASAASTQGLAVAPAAGGPATCTQATGAADCAAPGACPSDATAGCACASMSQGWVCVPQCTADADCPKPPDQTLTCLGGLCVRGIAPGGSAPVAGFGFSPSAPMATQAVAFTDTSTNGPTSWAWTFGDGGSSSAQNPAHTFASSGSYTVTLTATNTSGTNSLSRTVVVAPFVAGKVVASFTWSPATPVGGQAVTFTDTSSGAPTSWFWRFGDGGTSTEQHPTHVYAAATASGAYIVSLIASTATSTEMVNQDVTVKAAAKAAGTMSSVDTLSDQAQAMTIAFDGLAFVTGNFCAQTFYPPGKVADYFGFQFLRDNDPSGLGHNTEFTTLTADPILALLTDTQLAIFDQLQVDEGSLNDAYGYARFPLALAFRRLADGTGPTTSLSRQAVKSYTGALFAIDGQMSYLRATAYSAVLRSLSVGQQASLAAMKATYLTAAPNGGVGQWTQPDAAVVAAVLKKHPGQMLRTYAGEMLAWYLGTKDADVYFCPERQATYFGSFFMKDIKAMNNTAYTIDSNMTADMGNAFLTALDTTQKAKVTGLVDLQKPDLMGIMAKRDQLSRLLRTALTGAALDEATVLRLSEQYGELDGEISYDYATSFAGVSTTLSAAQRATLLAERQKATTQTTPTVADFDALCGNGYLYSAPLQTAPTIRDTGFLFGVCSAAGASCSSDWDCCSYACTGSGAKTCAAPFTFTSPAFADGGALPTTYTCSNPTLGNDAPSPPLAWSGAPAGTVEYAVTLTTYGLDGKRWNWILYGIPASATGLDLGNAAGLGTYGLSTDGPTRRYYPPCAQGSGTFRYTITLHALSGSPSFGVPADQVDGYLLEETIGKLTLASRQLIVTNTR